MAHDFRGPRGQLPGPRASGPLHVGHPSLTQHGQQRERGDHRQDEQRQVGVQEEHQCAHPDHRGDARQRRLHPRHERRLHLADVSGQPGHQIATAVPVVHLNRQLQQPVENGDPQVRRDVERDGADQHRDQVADQRRSNHQTDAERDRHIHHAQTL